MTQLLEMCHQFYNAINEDKDVRIIYLDISKHSIRFGTRATI